MRVRVIEYPTGDRWHVESGERFLFWWHWSFRDSFYGPDAKKIAIEYAKRLANPEVIEVSK